MKKLSTILLMIIVILFASLVQAQDHVPTPGTWMYDQNENKLDDRIEQIAGTSPHEEVGIIVVLRHHPEEQDIHALSQLGEIKYVSEYLDLVALRPIQAEMAFTIADNINVVMVELDETVRASIPTSVRAIRAKGSTTYSPNTAWEAGFRGSGINIAILDTGVDDDHPSLDDMDDNALTTNDSKFVAGYDATANPRIETNPDDDNTHTWNGYNYVKADIFHGTHVAGIALGTGGGTDSAGVAPEAKLIDVKVLDYRGSGTSSDVIAGIEWCIKNRDKKWAGQPNSHYGIDVLNLSLCGSSSDGQDAMSRAVNKAVEQGLVVCCAVGNDNKQNYICTPSSADRAISVGSVNDGGTVNRNNDMISSHASWGSNRGLRTDDNDTDNMDELKPDVTAYGSNIYSCKGVDPGQAGSSWQELGGTSMATPHVAGVCALILEAHPTFSPHDVKNILRETAEDKNGTKFSDVPKYDEDYGWGIVNAFEAVTTTNIPPDLWISRQPVWWYSEDIWHATKPEVGVANTIYARVHNTSGTAANNVTVRFRVGVFGIGQPNWLWTATATVNVPGTGVQTASVPWTPTAQQLTKGPGHPCIRVEIEYNNDPNTENNMAQLNLTIHESTSTAVFEFRGWNPFDDPSKIFFGLEKGDLPEGWDAYFEPDKNFELNYQDFVDGMVIVNIGMGEPEAQSEVKNSFENRFKLCSVTGDTGTAYIESFKMGTIESFGGVACSVKTKDAEAKVGIKDTSAAMGDHVMIPIIVSTEHQIGLAQFVLDYNSEIIELVDVRVGPGAEGFNIIREVELPFPPSSEPETNRNILVQLNGGGMHTFSGEFLKVAMLEFVVVDSIPGHHSPLIFDRDIERTFLTTVNLEDLRGEDLAIFNGFVEVRPQTMPVAIMVQYDLIDPPRPVADMEVKLTQANGEELIRVTNDDGGCMFEEVEPDEYHLSFHKDGDTRNAITGSDALLILKYLAFMEELSEPQMFAADVTVDKRVTGSDALAVLKHLAFFPPETDRTGFWGVDSLPIPIPEPAENVHLTAHAYLLGDVTLNWGADQSMSNSDDGLIKSVHESNITLHFKNNQHSSDGNILLPVSAVTFDDKINTCVFTIEYEASAMEYHSALKTAASQKFILAANGMEAGKVHVAMASASGIEKDSDILQLVFKPKQEYDKNYSSISFTRAEINDYSVCTSENVKVQLSATRTEIPETFQLSQNYPNPFNNETIISYGIPNLNGNAVIVSLNIYNLNGQLVKTLVDERKTPGVYTVRWNGTDDINCSVATGMYFYKIQAADFKAIRKLAILK